ncbi:hypothetical protein M9434_000609 [Picochlorum sp. BPE23]|nr:hypothetical protein M9434_000609 [Picochlorum sp. BPE23]KAI8111359.1 hypothetical protein M9435_003860 [Picochlorum sp. BPE23]
MQRLAHKSSSSVVADAAATFQKRRKRLVGRQCRRSHTTSKYSACDVVDGVRSGSLSAKDVMAMYLDRIERHDDKIRSFISVGDRQTLLRQAESVDQRVARGERVGPLAGLPVAVKDNLCTRGMPTTAGSRMLEGYVSPHDATAVARMRQAGAIVVGKTNMDEFGMGSSTENSGYHVTRNPWDLDRVPGGSSGGSAAAVSAGLAPCALGSDTGGSIRQPSHFCGVVGLKPTYGRVSRFGLLSYGSSLDTVGPMGTSVRDVSLLLETLSGGKDPLDATSSDRAPFAERGVTGDVDGGSAPLRGIRVGLLEDTLGDGVDGKVEGVVLRAAEHLASLGAHVDRISLPSFSYGLPAYYVIALSEASSNLSRYDGIRYGARGAGGTLRDAYVHGRALFGAEVKRRILMGTYALSAGYYDAYYKRAQQVRTLVTRELQASLQTYDVLLSPVAPNAAFRIGEKTEDPLEMYKGDLMTVNVNLAGVPALSIPADVVDSLPVGIQLIGRAFDEASLLRVGHVFEQTNSSCLSMTKNSFII